MDSKALTAQRVEVMQAFARGEKIQGRPSYCKTEDSWADCRDPAWAWEICDYRVAPAEDDQIPWDIIADHFNFSARDEDGRTFLFKGKPQIGCGVWCATPVDFRPQRIDHVLNIKIGGKHWSETLQERPKEGGQQPKRIVIESDYFGINPPEIGQPFIVSSDGTIKPNAEAVFPHIKKRTPYAEKVAAYKAEIKALSDEVERLKREARPSVYDGIMRGFLSPFRLPASGGYVGEKPPVVVVNKAAI